MAKCILDEALVFFENAEIKAKDDDRMDELSTHPMVLVAFALGRGFDSRVNVKAQAQSSNRLMLLLTQAGLGEDQARSFAEKMQSDQLDAVNQHLTASVIGGAAVEQSRIVQLQQEILANEMAMKRATGTLKVTKQADRKRISNRLATYISSLEEAALNKVDLRPEVCLFLHVSLLLSLSFVLLALRRRKRSLTLSSTY